MRFHLLGMFTQPKKEWLEIRNENESIRHAYFTRILFLAAITPLCAYYGTTQVGWVVGNGDAVKLTTASALPLTVLSYLAMLLGVAIMGAFIHWMARTYDAKPTIAQCVVFAAYTCSPLFVAGLAALYPNIWLAMLAGTLAVCYSVYLLYVGIPIYMNIPEEEGFFYASSILAIGLVVLVSQIAMSVILWGIGIGPVYTS